MRIPNNTEIIADFQGGFLSENGNNQTTGQQGDIPFILSQSGDIIIKAGKQTAVKKINKFLLYLIMIFQNLNPIYCFW